MAPFVLVAILLAFAGVILFRGEGDMIAGVSMGEAIAATVSVLLLVWIASALMGDYRGRLLKAMRDLAFWGAAMIVLVASYSYRDEIAGVAHRVAGELAPPGIAMRSEPQVDGERSVRIRRRPDGHFLARTEINGNPLTMLVDTGASTVVLKANDAQRLGIDTERLRYSVPVQTANGTTHAASIRLKTMAVGGIVFNDVEALVSKPGQLKDSLLGMSFLNRLRSYEFSGDFLTFRI
jgi:aspartyl protease family protein